MNDIRWRPVAIFGGVLLLAVLIVLGLIWATGARASGSNGELIYFRGINDRGEPIAYRGGTGFIGPGMMGTRLSCASCHGQEARGGVHMMRMQVMDAPDIRWSVLAGEVGAEHADEGDPDDEHAEAHASYDLVNFRMAVVEGKHPNGEPLSSEMPRWQISDGDLEDLAEFLRSPLLTEKGVLTMPGDFIGSGGWIIFPIIGIIMMAGFMFLMMSRWGGFGSRRDDYGRSPRGRNTEVGETETPLSILKSRYARGEISKDEYAEMKRELQ
ncbi:MAG: SHOCT domain-containing protein [Anaerolineales bacterium]